MRLRTFERIVNPTSRTGRRIRLLLPLALLSTAATVALVDDPSTDDGMASLVRPSVPAEAVEDPASYSIPGRISLGVPTRSASRVVATASTNGIPSAALAAYQRAETVMGSAEQACHITWQLIAAIGRVESDHGRYGGNTLTPTGVSRPGIYGIALDGTHHTTQITDTDAGRYDHDRVWDRAVGPMQFIPTTWTVVGVDADGDGRRNPQDLDDAALAAAVYLCSGEADLATDTGQRQALYRYNHSSAYVDLVLAIMGTYLTGDYTPVPNTTTSAVTFTPDHDYTPASRGHRGKHPGHRGNNSGGGTDPTPVAPDPNQPDPPPTSEPPTDDPADPDLDQDPVQTLQATVKDVQDGVQNTINNATGVLTLTQAILHCTRQGYHALLTPQAWHTCLDHYTNP